MKSPDDSREQAEFLISQYLDGMLNQADRHELEQRFQVDSDLARTLKAYQAVDHTVREWGDDVPQPDWVKLDAELRSRLEKASHGTSRLSRIYRLFVPVAAAAAIALVLLVQDSFTVSRRTPEAMVSIARPPTVAWQDHDAYVSYSRNGDAIVDRRPLVIAQAVVGRQVSFPTINRLRSNQ